MEKKNLLKGLILLIGFCIWTILIMTIDVQPEGTGGTDIGFAALNIWFHDLTGVQLTLYTITDWLGLVPVTVCMIFAGMGAAQMITRHSMKKVDRDILLLGAYYIIVIACYLMFEMIPVNYRPVLIEGALEASYPSSTTLLMLSVMPTLVFQAERRLKNSAGRTIIRISCAIFSAGMVTARLISGVHWCTDIAGGVLLSAGLFYIYKAVVLICDKK